MKRLVLSLSIFAVAMSFNACEQHTVAALPPHYQHKLHGHHEGGGGAKEESHPKAEGEKATPGEKKDH